MTSFNCRWPPFRRESKIQPDNRSSSNVARAKVSGWRGNEHTCVPRPRDRARCADDPRVRADVALFRVRICPLLMANFIQIEHEVDKDIWWPIGFFYWGGNEITRGSRASQDIAHQSPSSHEQNGECLQDLLACRYSIYLGRIWQCRRFDQTCK
jgi:hypothetical protein